MKDIKGYEGLYAITTNGQVWSYPKKIAGGHCGKFLKPLVVSSGYLQVGFRVKGSRHVYLVHRLVAQAFIPNPLEKKCINHKNWNKSDNRIGNLEWVSYKENMAHAKINNLTARGENNGNSKLNLGIVERIRNIKNKTFTDIGREFGISRVQVANIIKRKQWQR